MKTIKVVNLIVNVVIANNCVCIVKIEEVVVMIVKIVVAKMMTTALMDDNYQRKTEKYDGGTLIKS